MGTKIIWDDAVLFNRHTFNTGFPDDIYVEAGYCALISIFFIDLFYQNIMMKNTLNIFKQPPPVSVVKDYIKIVVNEVYNILLQNKISVSMIQFQ